MLLRNIYYALKPLMPRQLQIALRRRYAARLRSRCAATWPIDLGAAKPPQAGRDGPTGRNSHSC